MTAADAGPAATVRRYLDALNRGDADAVAACVSDGFVNEHTASLGTTVVGRAAYRERLGGFLDAFRSLRYEIEQLIADGPLVAVAYRMSATWHEPGRENAAGRPFTVRGMFRFRVEADRIVHRADYWDSADFLRQVRGPGLKA